MRRKLKWPAAEGIRPVAGPPACVASVRPAEDLTDYLTQGDLVVGMKDAEPAKHEPYSSVAKTGLTAEGLRSPAACHGPVQTSGRSKPRPTRERGATGRSRP
jgi:hypothetical protein